MYVTHMYLADRNAAATTDHSNHAPPRLYQLASQAAKEESRQRERNGTCQQQTPQKRHTHAHCLKNKWEEERWHSWKKRGCTLNDNSGADGQLRRRCGDQPSCFLYSCFSHDTMAWQLFWYAPNTCYDSTIRWCSCPPC